MFVSWLKRFTVNKLLLPTYKSLHGMAPSYIADLIKVHVPKRTLRSYSKLLLTAPPCREVSTTFHGERDNINRASIKSDVNWWNCQRKLWFFFFFLIWSWQKTNPPQKNKKTKQNKTKNKTKQNKNKNKTKTKNKTKQKQHSKICLFHVAHPK